MIKMTHASPEISVPRVIALNAGMRWVKMLVSFLTQRIPAFSAITLGTLISGLAWVILIIHPTVPMAILTLFTVSLGEITQSPRYYEYISRLAPSGQQGTYMGFAFLPIGIGSLIGGWFGGVLIHHFGELTHQRSRIRCAVTAVGVATAALLWIYDRVMTSKSNLPVRAGSVSE